MCVGYSFLFSKVIFIFDNFYEIKHSAFNEKKKSLFRLIKNFPVIITFKLKCVKLKITIKNIIVER